MAAPDPSRWQTGYFTGENCLSEAENFIQNFENTTLSKFVKVKSKSFKKLDQNEIQGRVYWEERSSIHMPVEYDGVPFIIAGSQVRECVNGPDRHRAEKRKKLEKNQDEHSYTVNEKKRRLLQPTKKLSCKASVYLRYIVKFPGFGLNSDTEWARKKKSKELKEAFRNCNVAVEHRVYVRLPGNDEHTGHLTEENLLGQV